MVRALNTAAADPTVAAIVVRIDSPGGDGLASDLMYRAVLEAKKKKPVVASMGDVAASGGYYAAMGADEVFALPTTLTGSIGVFFMKPAVEGLAQKLGVNREILKRGALADIDGLYSPWSPEERQAAQAWVDSFYDDFIAEVATSRNMEKTKVDQVARGRVWAGEAAKKLGLVDTLGGLHEAIESAKRRARLEGKEVSLVELGRPAGLFSSLGGEEEVRRIDAWLGTVEAPSALPEAVRAALIEAGLPSLDMLQPGLRAQLPFNLQLR